MDEQARQVLQGLYRPLRPVLDVIEKLMPKTTHTTEPIPSVKESVRPRHRRLAITSAVVLYGAFYTIFYFNAGGWLFQNPILSVGAGLDRLLDSTIPGMVATFVMLGLMAVFLYVVLGSFNSSMESNILQEERKYREGAEHWTWRQRARACFLFGLAHLTNLFYPYIAVVILTVGGAVFMREYLRVMRRTDSRQQALAACTALHHRYNLAMFFGFPVYLVVVIGTALLRDLL